MTTLWLTIAKAIAAELGPVVLAWATKEILPKVLAEIGKGFEKNLPALTAAVVAAIQETLATVAVDGVDRVTDLVPGRLDDELLDPIVARAAEIFRRLGR